MRKTKFLLIISLITFINCSSESIENLSSQIDLGFNSYLYFVDNDVLINEKSIIEMKARETVSLVNAKMPTENINIRVRISSTNVIPEIGIGGFNPNANEIILSINPNFSNLNQSLANELGPIIAHEMHHAKRRRSVGYGSSLLQAMITEGLADSFSMEIFDIDIPIWSNALSTNELDNWLEISSNMWNDVPYKHDEWFFGASSEIPRWTGYSIGFKLVQDYLTENPTMEPSDLVNEPASSFLE